MVPFGSDGSSFAALTCEDEADPLALACPSALAWVEGTGCSLISSWSVESWVSGSEIKAGPVLPFVDLGLEIVSSAVDWAKMLSFGASNGGGDVGKGTDTATSVGFSAIAVAIWLAATLCYIR